MKFIKKLLKWVCTIIAIGLIYQAFFGDEIIRWAVLVISALFLIPWLITKIDNEYNMSVAFYSRGETMSISISLRDIFFLPPGKRPRSYGL